jgi:hypothetical protein
MTHCVPSPDVVCAHTASGHVPLALVAVALFVVVVLAPMIAVALMSNASGPAQRESAGFDSYARAALAARIQDERIITHA